MTKHRFLVRNPDARKDVSTGKVAIYPEVHALQKLHQPPSDLSPEKNEYLLDLDSARLLISQVQRVLDQEQES